MIKSPNTFSPFNDPDRAHKRKALVLMRLLSLGKIGASQYNIALAEPIPTRRAAEHRHAAPYFIDFVRQQLTETLFVDVLNSEGLRISRTLDTELQFSAEQSLARGLNRLERTYSELQRQDPLEKLQGCLIAMQTADRPYQSHGGRKRLQDKSVQPCDPGENVSRARCSSFCVCRGTGSRVTPEGIPTRR
jgi:membrane carboxypeptidase/penicillin-binding protein